MKTLSIPFLLLCLSLFSCSSQLTKIQSKAQEYQHKIDFLKLETSSAQIKKNIDSAINQADEKLAKLIAIKPNQRNFSNTIAALDDIFFEFDKVSNRHYFINSVSPRKDLRDAATASIERSNKWSNQVFFRDDLYQAVKEYTQNKPKLSGEEKILFEDTEKAFKNNGFHLSSQKRKQLQKIKNEMSQVAVEFSNNVREYNHPVTFSSKDLVGVPSSALQGLKKNADNTYTMDPRIASHYLIIAQYAKNESVRKKALIARSSIAQKANAPLMTKLVRLRSELAQILGYKNFADYATEDKMAANSHKAVSFIQNLSRGLESSFQKQQKMLLELKRQETHNPRAKLYSWDSAYYERLYLEKEYKIDQEKLKEFFPMSEVLKGMFDIYQKVFGITIEEVKAQNKWIDDLKLYIIYDKQTHQALGTLYLDLYPREGKYNHFAQFGLMDGKTYPSGLEQRPIAALVCNFPTPQENKPSLLSFDHVETMFHEFGHALHNILSQTRFASQHGTHVPRDFVEAPSQMLEFWVRNKKVLDSFAKHYKTGEKIPRELLDNLFASKKVFQSRFTRGQIAYAMTDLNLHTLSSVPKNFDIIKQTNETISRYYMPRPQGSSFITSFGHLAGGYAAGYYGYQWSLAIASDMAQKFEQAPDKYFSQDIGMKLRREIYQVGGSRDVNESIEKFLGRKTNLKAYLNELGIKN